MTDHSKLKQLLVKAWGKRRTGKYDDARNLVNEAHQLCEDEDYDVLGRIFHIYMQFESDHNNLSEAMEFCQQSIRHYKKANNSDKIAHATRHLADLEYRLGKVADSERHYRVVIDIYKANVNTFNGDLANALRGFALVLEKRKKNEEAIIIWMETKALYMACNIQAGVDEANQKLNALL